MGGEIVATCGTKGKGNSVPGDSVLGDQCMLTSDCEWSLGILIESKSLIIYL